MIKTIVVSITNEIISNFIFESGDSIAERIKKWFFIRKLRKWVDDFIRTHEGYTIESGSFITYIEYSNPLQRVFENVTSGNSIDPDALINELINNYASRGDNNTGVIDRSILKDFFSKYYRQIDDFYRQKLTSNQKYMLGRIEQNNSYMKNSIDENSRAILDDISEIKKQLISGNAPSNYLDIYETLSKKILDGNIAEVKQLLPLLQNKHSDLENGVSMLIRVMSGEDTLSSVACCAEEIIVDESIYNSIIRVIVFLALVENDTSVFTSIGARNKDIHEIVGLLQSQSYDALFVKEKQEQDGITCITFKVLNNYPEESWLIQRICMLFALNDSYYIKDEYLDSIIPLPANIIDKILVAERRTAQMTVHDYNNNEVDVKKLYEDIRRDSALVGSLPQIIQIKYYVSLLRLGHILSEDITGSIICEIPDSIKSSVEIEELIAFEDVKKGTADESKIINICMKVDRYWLLYDYLLPIVNSDIQTAKEIIEKHLFVIDKEFLLFLMYYRIVNSTSEKEVANDLLKNYEEKYGHYYEYWTERINLTKEDADFRKAFEESKSNKLEYVDINTPYVWISIINEYEEYDAAVEAVESFEKKGFTTLGLKYQKAYALQSSGHEIEALSEYICIFSEGNRSDIIIYQIIYLSITNHRSVDQAALRCADKSDNSDILSAAAFYYNSHGDHKKALLCIKRALLRTNDVNSRAYGYYINLRKEDFEKENSPKTVDVDTVVHLRNHEDNTELIIAVHDDNIIPEDKYEWNGAVHINKDTAILIGLYRLQTGETAKLQEGNYLVESIENVEDFLSTVCFQKIVENGTAKTITLSLNEEGNPDLQAFTESVKSIVGETDAFSLWQNNYMDPESTPVPFFTWSKTSRAKSYQLVCATVDDPQIIYRESRSLIHSNTEEYVLSYASVIVLYKIGWNPSTVSKPFSVPNTLCRIISEETNEVIITNNSDHVASLGVQEGNLLFSESQEELKRKEIKEATSIKKYCEQFESTENTKDLHLPDAIDGEIRSMFGVADYDALSIAKSNCVTLVSAEVPLSMLASIQELDIDTVCITDFLCEVTGDVFILLDYIYYMVEHKFLLPITDALINRMVDAYMDLDYQGKKVLIDKWEKILSLPLADESYCRSLSTVLFPTILEKHKDTSSMNQIIMLLYIYFYKYMGYTLTIDISEKGADVSLTETRKN